MNKSIELRIEENLRNAFENPNFKKISYTNSIPLHNKFPIITAVSLTNINNDSTINSIVLNQSRFPYFIMAGDWMFQLFESEKHIKSSVEWLYGLRDIIKTVKASELVKDKSHAIILNELNKKSIWDKFSVFLTKKRIEGLYKTIRVFYYYLFKKKSNEAIVQYIFNSFFKHLNEGKTEVDSLVHAFNDLNKIKNVNKQR